MQTFTTTEADTGQSREYRSTTQAWQDASLLELLSGEGFARSLVRQVLFAVSQVVKDEQTQDGLNWLKTELPDYWQVREKIIHFANLTICLLTWL